MYDHSKGPTVTPAETIQAAAEQARADAFRDYSDPEDAHVAFSAIDRVAAHVAAVLEAQ
jgi:hypothetical protein